MAFEPLTHNVFQGFSTASGIGKTKRQPMIITKVELGRLAVQVLLGAVLVNARHAPLEHAVEAFDRVCVDGASAIFASAVSHVLLAGEVLAKVRVLAGFVRHDRRLLGDVGADDRHQLRSCGAIDMERASGAAALDQGQKRMLMRVTAPHRLTFFPANEGLVHLNDLAFATERREVAGPHGFAETVRQEPSRLVLHL